MLYLSGADVNAETREGLTAAYFCLFSGHASFLKELLNHGVDLNKQYKELRRTLLHYSALGGHEKMIKVLLRRNADTEIHAGERGFTPLHLATRMGQEKAVATLLKYGAKDRKSVV